MKVAFVCDNMPLTGNLNGAAALNYSHLRGLLKALPEASFHLVVLEQHAAYTFSAAEITAEFGDVPVTRISFREEAGRKGDKKRLFGTGISPLLYFYPFLTPGKLRELQSVLDHLAPDLIWTEHLAANLAVRLIDTSAPVVYGHHDFLWKVIGLRQRGGGWKKKLLNAVRKRAETRLIGANAYFAGGSRTELDEIRRRRPGAVTALLPAAYAPVAAPPAEGHTPARIRIIHLGTLSATANRIGLERFLSVCWPALHGQFPQLECLVVGDLGAAPSEALRGLLRQPNVHSLGFVPDLGAVLRPGDIFVIPYEYDTGTRTRLPLALNYRQVLVTTRAGSRGMEGLVNGENCIIADSLPDMTRLIAGVLKGETDYVRLAGKGRELFERVFTAEGQAETVRRFLQKIFGKDG